MNWVCPLPSDQFSLMRSFFCRGWSPRLGVEEPMASFSLSCPWLIPWPSELRQRYPRKGGCIDCSWELRFLRFSSCLIDDVWCRESSVQGDSQVWGREVVSSRVPQRSLGWTESWLGVLVKLRLKALTVPQTKYGRFERKEHCRSHTHKLWEITADGY